MGLELDQPIHEDWERIRLRARASAPTSLEVKLADRWTHPDGGWCSSCYDHPALHLEVGTEWATLVIDPSLARQAGWGTPSPGPDGQRETEDDGALDREGLRGVYLQLGPGDVTLELDDLELVAPLP